MKRLVAILLVLAMVLPLGVVSCAEDFDDEDLAALIILGMMADEYESSGSSSSKTTSKKSKTPSVPSSSAPVTAVQPYTANVKTNGGVLNIRQSANKGSTILRKVNNGTELTVLGYTGEWLKVSAYGTTGFVPSRYVSGATGNAVAASAPGAAPVANNGVYAGTGLPYYAIVNPTNNFVNMRAQPNKSAPVVGVYYYGYTLKVVADLGYWCQVVDENTGKQGYMLKSLLQINYNYAGDNG